MVEFLKILSFILISSVKFAIGPPIVYLNDQYDFTWLETNLYGILGGMIGVVFFMHLSEWLMDLWDAFRHKFFHRKNKKQLFSPPVADVEGDIEIHYEYVEHAIPKRKRFTPRTRKLVRIWKKYGLIGLAALTPILISIPIGTFFMTKLEKNKKKIILYMFISVTSWSLILTTILELIDVQSIQELFG
ncbi:MAG: hypothetical protein DWQ44_03880 [Bacteroidetes bacterium]|nr:MAG: hypothetical protein DWQ33_00175 [Bacteroidota bacterium]REK05056.1 MAG: hypothetical protein DWQ39_07550 [Bacteroidota bacterium]REK35554.1 MAG: hypothetical protein DWQ44_03880 [Bacteroidota bacterium]REK51657.1 MAG: hypothetical protein DWQ48_00455 [Bacteroidota bacterium]